MTTQQLIEQIRKKNSFLCIGLDVDLNKIPKHLLNEEDPIFAFNKAIIDAITNSNLIFDYATQYYYSNKINSVNDFKFTDSDFNNFKSYLKSNNFTFETKTEKLFDKAIKEAQDEDLLNDITNDYKKLVQSINASKDNAIDSNKEVLISLLKDEIIKRYFYREGLYEYYLKENPEIMKSTEILGSNSLYSSYFKA